MFFNIKDYPRGYLYVGRLVGHIGCVRIRLSWLKGSLVVFLIVSKESVEVLLTGW